MSKIHGNAFEQHAVFVLSAFDYLATENAKRMMFLRLSVSSEALQAESISNSVERDCIEYNRRVQQAKEAGFVIPPPPPSIKLIADLRKGINACEASFFGVQSSTCSCEA